MKSLSDYIKDAVTATSTIERPVYFLFGNWMELCNDLGDKAQSPTYRNQRYPLVLMHNEYKENREIGWNKVKVDELKLYIICQSEIVGSKTNPENYSTEQRKESIYKLILNPIYESLIIKIGYLTIWMLSS